MPEPKGNENGKEIEGSKAEGAGDTQAIDDAAKKKAEAEIDVSGFSSEDLKAHKIPYNRFAKKVGELNETRTELDQLKASQQSEIDAKVAEKVAALKVAALVTEDSTYTDDYFKTAYDTEDTGKVSELEKKLSTVTDQLLEVKQTYATDKLKDQFKDLKEVYPYASEALTLAHYKANSKLTLEDAAKLAHEEINSLGTQRFTDLVEEKKKQQKKAHGEGESINTFAKPKKEFETLREASKAAREWGNAS